MKKFNYKKISLGLMVVFVVVGLVGCGKKATNSKEGIQPQQKEELELTDREKEILKKHESDDNWNNLEKLIERDEELKKLIDGHYEISKVDTSAWKSFGNSEIGFQIKIPQDWKCLGYNPYNKFEEEFEETVEKMKKRRKAYLCAEKNSFSAEGEDFVDSFISAEGNSARFIFTKDAIFNNGYRGVIEGESKNRGKSERLDMVSLGEKKELMNWSSEDRLMSTEKMSAFYGKDELSIRFLHGDGSGNKILDGIISSFEKID